MRKLYLVATKSAFMSPSVVALPPEAFGHGCLPCPSLASAVGRGDVPAAGRDSGVRARGSSAVPSRRLIGSRDKPSSPMPRGSLTVPRPVRRPLAARHCAWNKRKARLVLPWEQRDRGQCQRRL